MKNKMKILFITLLCIGLFMGCNSDAETPEKSDEPKDNDVQSEEQVSIEFFNQKAEVKDLVDDILADYQEAHPEVKIEHIQIPDSRNVLYTRMASDDMPDIVSIFPDESDFKKQAEEDFFLDLTGEKMFDNIEDIFMDGIQVDDKDYSVPLTVNAYGIYYNEDKFKELGIEVPKTWADLEKAAKTIKDAGYIPFATSFKETWTTGHFGEALIGNSLGVSEARDFFLNKDEKAEDCPNIDVFLDRAQFISENTQEDSAGTDYASVVNLFVNQEALMLPQGIWAVPMIDQAEPQFEYKMFPVPSDVEDESKVVYGIDYALAIANSTEHAEEAKSIVEYFTTQEVAQYIHDNEKSPSTIKNVEAKNDKTVDVTSLLLEEGRSYKWIHFDWEPGKDPEWQDITSNFFIENDRTQFFENIKDVFDK